MLLHARDLVVTLSGDAGEVRVLDRVSLEVPSAAVIDVVGPSGSGKTTLLRALARLLPGAAGTLSLEGVEAHSIAGPAWRARVALLPQKPALVDGTVRDNLLRPWTLRIRRGSDQPGDRALETALADVALDAALDRDASRLSVGQQARVAFARTLLTNPKVLLLDEPDAALDEVSSAAVSEVTRRFAEKGGGVVRVRHHRSDDIAHRLLRLADGLLTDAGGV